MRHPIRRYSGAAIVAALVGSSLACSNAGSDLGFAAPATGGIVVQVYLDRDGSRSLSGLDTTFAGAAISITASNGGTAVRTVASASNGNSVFEDLEVGDYGIRVEPAALGDSLEVENVSSTVVRIVAGGAPPVVAVRLGYPEFSVRQARQLVAGKRVVIRGLVLAGLQSFRDTTSNVKDTSLAIRLTRTSVRSGAAGNNPGDSVTVLGTVSSRAGQPTLDRAIITVFANRPAPVATSLTSAVAAAAQGGTLDAALVLVTGLVISESGPQGPDFRIVASDGSAPITVIIDGTLPVNPAAFPVGRTMNVRGVLVPDGAGKWQLKPRDGNDVTLF